MSLHLTYETVCDFCGERCELQQYGLTPSIRRPYPQPVATRMYTYVSAMGELDLCPECAKPICQAAGKAYEDRMIELRAAGRLKGFEKWPADSKDAQEI